MKKRFLGLLMSAVMLAVSVMPVSGSGFLSAPEKNLSQSIIRLTGNGQYIREAVPAENHLLRLPSGKTAVEVFSGKNLPVLKESVASTVTTDVTTDENGNIYAKFIPERTGRYSFHLADDSVVAYVEDCYNSDFVQSLQRYGFSIYLRSNSTYYLSICGYSAGSQKKVVVNYEEDASLSIKGSLNRNVLYKDVDVFADTAYSSTGYRCNIPGILPLVSYRCHNYTDMYLPWETIAGDTLEYRLNGMGKDRKPGTYMAQAVLTDAVTRAQKVLNIGYVELKKITELPLLEKSGTIDAVVNHVGEGWFRFKTGSGKKYSVVSPYKNQGEYISVYKWNGSKLKYVKAASSAGAVTLTPNTVYYIAAGFNYESVYPSIESFYKTMKITVEDKDSAASKVDMTGVVTNSATGKALANVSLNFRKGSGNKSGSVYVKVKSDSGGKYTAALEEGQYTVQLSKTGYVTTYVNIECKQGKRVDLSISPRLAAGQFRVVLSWGEKPEDLDAHLTGPLSDGKRFHVFYYSTSAVDNGKQVAKVDVDDKTSYGPETVTLNLDVGASGVYRYYIHDYTNKHLTSSSGLANSGARVTVYKGDKQIASYNVPHKAGTKWHVFNIRNGKLVTVNEMSYETVPGHFE